MRALLVLVWALGSVSAWAASPVQLIDSTASARADSDFSARPDTRALRDFIDIVYDRLIERPWGKNYWTESQKRWDSVRSLLCPELKKFCALPATFLTEADQTQVMEGVRSPEILAELQAHFGKDGGVSTFTIHPLSTPAGGFMVSGGTTAWTTSPLSIWGMKSDGVRVFENEFLQVADVWTYAASFFGPSAYYYLPGAESEGSPILMNLDRVRAESLKFATTWKLAVRMVLKHPEIGEAPSTLFFDEYFLHRFFRDHATRFEEVNRTLQERLRRMDTDAAREALARFENERASDDFAEEVYQHVTYSIFHDLILGQAEYLTLAEKGRPGLEFWHKIWESLLHLQAEREPQLTLFLTYLEFGIPRSSVLRQFVTSPIAGIFFLEEVRAMLDEGHYANEHLYPKLSYALRAPELWDRAFLEENAPEALEALKDPSTGEIRDIFLLPEAEQKRIFHLYVYGHGTQPRVPPVYRMMISMMGRISAEDSRLLARHVHRVRAGEFGDQAAGSGRLH